MVATTSEASFHIVCRVEFVIPSGIDVCGEIGFSCGRPDGVLSTKVLSDDVSGGSDVTDDNVNTANVGSTCVAAVAKRFTSGSSGNKNKSCIRI